MNFHLIAMVMISVVQSKEIEHKFSNHQAEEFRNIVKDKEHLKEELGDIFSPKEIDKMSPDEEAYNWFKAHDTDDDEFLDGLEIYKSINHAIQHNADQQSANIEDEFRTGVEDQAAVDLVDEIIEHYDLNNDGMLSSVEFIKSIENEKTIMSKL